MTMNPSVKGFQPKAFNSVSELRSSGWKKHTLLNSLLQSFNNFVWLILNIGLLPLFPSTHIACPLKDSCSQVHRVIFILPHCPPFYLTNTKESGPIKSVGILPPNSLLTGPCRPDFKVTPSSFSRLIFYPLPLYMSSTFPHIPQAFPTIVTTNGKITMIF